MQIVVASCGKYSDAWGPFVDLFHKFWPECSYPLNLITDYQTAPWKGDKAIELGQDLGWGNNLIAGFRKLENPQYVFLFQEDFFISNFVDTDKVKMALCEMRMNPNIACFRFYPCPGPDFPLTNWFGLITQKAPYRVSCQAAIWRRQELELLLRDCNTAADFEIMGTQKSQNRCACIKYYSVNRDDPAKWPLQYYCSAITRGAWNPDAVAYVKAQGIAIDTTKRPFLHCPS